MDLPSPKKDIYDEFTVAAKVIRQYEVLMKISPSWYKNFLPLPVHQKPSYFS